MKHIVIIGTILVLLILTAGCLDDLSSTLPPCCDGTCDGVKTSVITIEQHSPFSEGGRYFNYVRDSDGLLYAFGLDEGNPPLYEYDPYNNHNVTFSYSMVNGHRHITGIIEDHKAKAKIDYCCYVACCSRNCSCPHEGCGI